MQNPIDLALFEGTLYWLKAGTGELTSYKLYGPRERRIGKRQLYVYNTEHFTILQSAMQPTGEVLIELTVCNQITWLVIFFCLQYLACRKNNLLLLCDISIIINEHCQIRISLSASHIVIIFIMFGLLYILCH